MHVEVSSLGTEVWIFCALTLLYFLDNLFPGKDSYGVFQWMVHQLLFACMCKVTWFSLKIKKRWGDKPHDTMTTCTGWKPRFWTWKLTHVLLSCVNKTWIGFHVSEMVGARWRKLFLSCKVKKRSKSKLEASILPTVKLVLNTANIQLGLPVSKQLKEFQIPKSA